MHGWVQYTEPCIGPHKVIIGGVTLITQRCELIPTPLDRPFPTTPPGAYWDGLASQTICVLAVAKRASLIVAMEMAIESCVRGHRFSKNFCTPKETSWLVCQREKGDSNDVYTVAVKTDGTKTVQIKRSNDLLSFQLHLIIDFVLTERKLAHGPVQFPARSIGHFAMNIYQYG